MATIDVKDATGVTQTIEAPNANGRADAADARPVVLSNEDKAALDDVASQTTLAAVLAKIIAAPATEAKQDAGNTTLGTLGTEVTLAAILAKIIATPATSAKQDTGNTSLGNIVSLLTTQAGYLDGLETLLAAATPAGANIIGKVGVDQTTDGTTNKVNIDASLKSGTATRSTVTSGVSSGTILASNANRKGAVILNSDANVLLLDLSGGTAASTRYQVRLTQYQNYEIPSGYTGGITGIWEADGSGQADVVEFT